MQRTTTVYQCDICKEEYKSAGSIGYCDHTFDNLSTRHDRVTLCIRNAKAAKIDICLRCRNEIIAMLYQVATK